MQLAMIDVIDEKRTLTERKLFEHFDEDVAERFRRRQSSMATSLDRIERSLMTVTKHELRDHARFSNTRSFVLTSILTWTRRSHSDATTCRRRVANRWTCRVISIAPGHATEPTLDPRGVHTRGAASGSGVPFGGAAGRQSSVEAFVGTSGWMAASLLSIEMEAGGEDHMLLVGLADDGRTLDATQIETLFRIPGDVPRTVMLDSEIAGRLGRMTQRARQETVESLETRMEAWIAEEQAKLDAWEDDRRANLAGVVDKYDKEISAKRRELRERVGRVAGETGAATRDQRPNEAAQQPRRSQPRTTP